MAYIDTHQEVKSLIGVGFEEKQAEVITNMINKRDGTSANKEDISSLRNEIKADIVGLRSELKADIVGLRNEIKADIVGLESKIKDFKSDIIQSFVLTQFISMTLIISILTYFK